MVITDLVLGFQITREGCQGGSIFFCLWPQPRDLLRRFARRQNHAKIADITQLFESDGIQRFQQDVQA